MSYFDDASLVLIPSGYKNQKIYSVKPTDGTGDLTFSRASTATRVNASGLIEAVASGLPRLDYLNSTCPKLLLEGQRSNLVLYSEQFDNAYWTKLNVTVTANDAVAPDGTTTADKLIEDTSDNLHFVRADAVARGAAGGLLSNSFFAKAGERRFITFTGGHSNAQNYFVVFDLQDGVVVTSGVSGTSVLSSFNIELIGNGWYRCTVVGSVSASFTHRLFYISLIENPADIDGRGQETYTGDGTSGIYIWGAQIEEGAYATSYIPTLAASVTRVAETALKTSASSLIGASAGVVYFEGTIEGDKAATTRRVISISDGTTSNFLNVYNPPSTRGLDFVTAVGGTVQCNIVSSTSIFQYGQRFKMAFAYAQNDFAFYINGTQIGIDESGNIPSGLDRIIFGRADQNSAVFFEGNVSQTLLFKTRLTNDQLAELTA
jgi:hypothetical protein